MGENRFDDFYFTIVKETGGLEGLLHSLFSFLYRRTDFFYECDPGDKMGFPPGAAPKMVMNIFEMYQKEHYKRMPKKDPQQYAEKLKKYQEKKQKEVQTTTTQQTVQQTNQKAEKVPNVSAPVQKEEQKQPKDNKVSSTEEQSKVTKSEVETKPKQVNTSISTYNGGSNSKYNWSQSTNDVTVQIPLPQGTKAKNLQVDYTPTTLNVKHLPTNNILIKGEFFEKIKVDDSIWSIDNDSLILTLEKMTETIWKTVLKGDEEIDTTKVDNSKPIHEFDSETQVALKKIMYEQQRKMQGLPTTEEEKQLDMLKQAWNSEGSPFKGTPFDPKKFNLPGANSFNIE